MKNIRLLTALIILICALSSCSSSNNSGTSADTASKDGTIYGLDGTIVLQNNGGDDLTASDNGSFSFSSPVATDEPNSVTIKESPEDQTCKVLNDAGITNDTSVSDTCVICTSNSSAAFPTQGNGTDEVYISIPASDGRWIAIKLEFPDHSRYNPDSTGRVSAPIVLETPPTFTEYAGFFSEVDVTKDGCIHASILWPGLLDEETRLASDGEFDYGGAQSTDAMRATLLFLTGNSISNDGLSINNIYGTSAIRPEPKNTGIFAFSHSGIVATITMALYGHELSGVSWFVGHENPTQDVINCFELGRIDSASGTDYTNPYYSYAQYHPMDIDLGEAAFSSVGWDPSERGSPYFVDSQGVRYTIGEGTPFLFDKRQFSYRLTRALQDNGALDLSNWPKDLATPEEAKSTWAIRQTTTYYEQLGIEAPGLKVMLVFGIDDHAQPMPDKPQIHQAWDGFQTNAHLPWVRLNPDRAYIESVMGTSLPAAPDIDANWAPESWRNMSIYSYPDEASTTQSDFSRAAIAEMADRTEFGDWSVNLSSTLVQ